MANSAGRPFVALLSGMSMAYSQLVTAGFGVFLASFIGASEYGTVNLARNIFLIALVLSPLGLDLALQRHLAEEAEEQRGNDVLWLRAITVALALGVTALLFAFLGEAIETHVFRHAGFGLILAATIASLPFATDMAVLGGAFRGVYQPLPSVVTTYFIQPTLRMLAILLLLAWFSGIWAVTLGTLISYALAWAFLALRAARVFPPAWSRLAQARRKALGVLRYSPWLGLSYFVFTLARSFDTMALGYWAPLADVGRYAIVQMVGQMVAMIGIALGQTLGTSVAAAFQRGEHAEMRRLLTENMAMASLLCAPFCVAIAIWGSDIDLLLGKSYVIPGAIFVIAAGTQWLTTVTQYSSVALSLTGRHKIEFYNNVLALVVQVGGCVLLVPRHGMLGAAVSSLLSILVINLARQIQIGQFLGGRLVGFGLLAPLGISALVAVPFWALGNSFPFRAWWLTGALAGTHVLVSLALVTRLLAPRHRREKLMALLRRNRGGP